jgi:Flp pilus assembly protein TadD
MTYLLALMSKPSALPLPFLILLLDYWPLQRLSKKAVLEKIPLFVICGIFAVLAMISQSTFGLRGPGTYNFITTVLLICHNNIAYLYNIFWPANLALFYAFPMWIPVPLIIIGTIGSGVLFLISLRWTKALLTGWLFFFIAISPVLGITWVHDMIIADRHVYLPLTGILVFISYLLSRISDKVQGGLTRNQVLRFLAVTILSIVIILEMVLTRKYLVYWKDTETHHRRMVELAPQEPIVHSSLGIELFKQGRFDEAISHYNKALTLRPGIETAIHYNMANALMRLGRFDEAVKHYAESVRLNPNQADVYDCLGWALASLGKFDEAVENCKKALKLAPDLITAHGHLGLALAGEGRTDEAVRELQIFLLKLPDDFEMHCNLGILLEEQGKTDEAAEQYRQALKLNPDYTKAGERLKAVLEKRGK